MFNMPSFCSYFENNQLEKFVAFMQNKHCMMDLTIKKYALLLEALKDAGYQFVTFRDYCENKEGLGSSR